MAYYIDTGWHYKGAGDLSVTIDSASLRYFWSFWIVERGPLPRLTGDKIRSFVAGRWEFGVFF
jgi:hypothetical protein